MTETFKPQPQQVENKKVKDMDRQWDGFEQRLREKDGGAPTVRYEDSNSGIYCSSGALRRNEFTWSPQEKRWLLTNSEIVVISGGRF